MLAVSEGKAMEYRPDFYEDEEEGGLVRLSRVKYLLTEGQPDAMGWAVGDIDGIEFGKVTDLLADAMSGQIVFAAVTSFNSGKTALIPVEGMYLDLHEHMLVVPVKEMDVLRCPDFTDDTVDVMPYVEFWLQQAAM